MLNKIKNNSSDYLPPKVIIEQSQNNLYNIPPPKIGKLNKKVSTQKIPKLNLNNLTKCKKRLNSMVTLKKYKFDKFLDEKNSFLFCQKNQKLIDYYFQKNKSHINDLSLKAKIKNSSFNKLTTKNDKKINNINHKKTEKTTKTIPKIKAKITKSSSIPIFKRKLILRNKSNISKRLNQTNNQDSDYNNINEKFYDNNSKCLINLKKCIEERKNVNNYLHILINNDDLNCQENSKIGTNYNKMKYSPLKYNHLMLRDNFLHKKKIDVDTLNSISNEYNIIKDRLERKNAEEEEKFKKRIFRKKVKLDKLRNDKNTIEKFIYEPKNKNNIIIDQQINLLKKKIKEDKFTSCKDIENSNSFTSQLFLYISNPYEQLVNTRLYGKIMEDHEFLKDLHHNDKLLMKEV